MKKFCLIIPIKPEYANVYKEIHIDPWPDMLAAIREAGFTNEVIYYFNDQSIVFLECADLDACDARLRATAVCQKWDETVCPWFAGEPVLAEKIFDLNQQLDGRLSKD
jgi:L-rhamnose mutarotase